VSGISGLSFFFFNVTSILFCAGQLLMDSKYWNDSSCAAWEFRREVNLGLDWARLDKQGFNSTGAALSEVGLRAAIIQALSQMLSADASTDPLSYFQIPSECGNLKISSKYKYS